MAFIYDRDNHLTRYVVDYFGGFMTPHEKAAYKSVIGHLKIQDAPEQEKALRKMFVSDDIEVLKLLDNGSGAFLRGVRERILRDHSDKVFLNYCPRCNALARTPKAKQCWQCFFNWHAQE